MIGMFVIGNRLISNWFDLEQIKKKSIKGLSIKLSIGASYKMSLVILIFKGSLEYFLNLGQVQ